MGLYMQYLSRNFFAEQGGALQNVETWKGEQETSERQIYDEIVNCFHGTRDKARVP